MRARLLMVFLLVAGPLVAGCGQKGPLYREVPASVTAEPQSAPASATDDERRRPAVTTD